MAVIDGLLPPELEFIQSFKYRNGHLWEVKKKSTKPRICPRCGGVSSHRYGRAIHMVREQGPMEKPLSRIFFLKNMIKKYILK